MYVSTLLATTCGSGSWGSAPKKGAVDTSDAEELAPQLASELLEEAGRPHRPQGCVHLRVAQSAAFAWQSYERPLCGHFLLPISPGVGVQKRRGQQPTGPCSPERSEQQKAKEQEASSGRRREPGQGLTSQSPPPSQLHHPLKSGPPATHLELGVPATGGHHRVLPRPAPGPLASLPVLHLLLLFPEDNHPSGSQSLPDTAAQPTR